MLQMKIFATRDDWMRTVRRIEGGVALKYAQTGLFKAEQIECYCSLEQVPNLGVNLTGQYITGLSLLVCREEHRIEVEEVRQKKGGVLYNVSQLLNPDSVVLQPGGIYGDRCIIRGGVGTVSRHKQSIHVFNLFKKMIHSEFVRIKDWYVGRDALRLANSGYRLITMHAGESSEYDLAVS